MVAGSRLVRRGAPSVTGADGTIERMTRSTRTDRLSSETDDGLCSDGDLAQLEELMSELLRTGRAPDDLLRMLDDSHGGAAELVDGIEGLLRMTPQQMLGDLLDGFAPLLKRGVGGLAAELCGAEFLSSIRAVDPDGTDLPMLLTDLIGRAEVHGGPEALAMLRVLAATGPHDVRPVAAGAGDRLVAGGLIDPPWTAGLGRPKVGPSFGYGDFFGDQEAIALTFSYGRKRHALVVLIDHLLGGGVKDCFVTDQPDVIRTYYRDSAESQGLELPFYEPAQALAILDEALSRPPCPEQPDQVEDVRDHLDLLRSRMQLLRDGQTGAREQPQPSVHRLKVTLAGIRPPVWRRIEVPSTVTLQQLHQDIQHAFGWYGYHLWVFSTPLGEFGTADPELGHRSAASKTLADVARARGDRIDYTYDFGDDWVHRIVVEDVHPADPDVAYPRCLTGRRATPPEDCGGPWGYASLLDILADAEHPEHAQSLDWLGLESGEKFDPACFDITDVNEALSRRR